MKALTAILLLFSMVLPSGIGVQAMAPPSDIMCTMVDDAGKACCEPVALHCCCDAAPAETPPPVQPQPQAPNASSAKDVAASLPNLLMIAELPRLSDSTAGSIPLSDRAAFKSVPPARLCVLRCSLLI